jgi:RNA recognition motif-containing protein
MQRGGFGADGQSCLWPSLACFSVHVAWCLVHGFPPAPRALVFASLLLGAPSSFTDARRRPFAVSVLVKGLPWTTTSEELKEFFQQNGVAVSNVEVLMRGDGRSTGQAIVKTDQEKADAVVALNGAEIGGRWLSISIKTDDFGGNAGGAYAGGGGGESSESSTLIVKNLSWNTTEDSLKGLFQTASNARIIYEQETGRSKG